MVVLVCSDRDGTINLDKHFYLGKTEDWKEKIEFLPGVLEGIKLLNSIEGLEFFIITNQSGVALSGEFSNFTVERMHEVNKYIISKLEEQDAKVKGYVACPYVDSKYVEKKAIPRGRTVNPNFVDDNCQDLKPKTGMLEKAAESLGLKLNEIEKKYMIGDRATDIELGLNANGKSVFVPSEASDEKDEGTVKKFMELNPGRVYIAKDFLEAAKWIVDDLKN